MPTWPFYPDAQRPEQPTQVLGKEHEYANALRLWELQQAQKVRVEVPRLCLQLLLLAKALADRTIADAEAQEAWNAIEHQDDALAYCADHRWLVPDGDRLILTREGLFALEAQLARERVSGRQPNWNDLSFKEKEALVLKHAGKNPHPSLSALSRAVAKTFQPPAKEGTIRSFLNRHSTLREAALRRPSTSRRRQRWVSRL